MNVAHDVMHNNYLYNHTAYYHVLQQVIAFLVNSGNRGLCHYVTPPFYPTILAPVALKKTNMVCENKGVDQLCSNRSADQRLCFCYIDSTIISSL